MFQFHKVRLKEVKLLPVRVQQTEFQFHKVRLKETMADTSNGLI